MIKNIGLFFGFGFKRGIPERIISPTVYIACSFAFFYLQKKKISSYPIDTCVF